MDLSKLSAEELEQLAKDAMAAAKKKREEEKKEVRREIDAMLRARGFTLQDIYAQMQGVDVKTLPAIAYQDPEDPLNTWTGQGRRPKWLLEAIAAGRTLEEFKVK